MKRWKEKVVDGRGKWVLRYYLFGSRKEGYSIVIQHEKETEIIYSKYEKITRNILRARDFWNKLVRGVVFPEQLKEIVEDQF